MNGNNHPTGLTCYENKIYVADSYNQIQVFSFNGKLIKKWGKKWN